MEYPIPNPSGNKMLSLVNELYQRSTGMCRAGAGPYGIGVSVVEDTPIDVFFTFDPDPVLDCKILPEEIPEYTVGVIGSWSGERKYLSREEVGQLLSASDPKTRILAEMLRCALPGFVDSKNEEKTERNAGYLVVSHSGGGMLRQGTRKGIRRTPANRGMRAHWVVKGLDISEDVCHGMCP